MGILRSTSDAIQTFKRGGWRCRIYILRSHSEQSLLPNELTWTVPSLSLRRADLNNDQPQRATERIVQWTRSWHLRWIISFSFPHHKMAAPIATFRQVTTRLGSSALSRILAGDNISKSHYLCRQCCRKLVFSTPGISLYMFEVYDFHVW